MKLSLKKAIAAHSEAMRRLEFARRTTWYTNALPSDASDEAQYKDFIQAKGEKVKRSFEDRLNFIAAVHEIGRMIKKAHQLHGVIDLQSEHDEIGLVLKHFPSIEGPITRGTKPTPAFDRVRDELEALSGLKSTDHPPCVSLLSQDMIDEMTARYTKLTERQVAIKRDIDTINAIGYIYPSPECLDVLKKANLIS